MPYLFFSILLFFRGTDFSFGFVFPLHNSDFQLPVELDRSFVRLFNTKNSSCIQSSLGCEICKSCFLQFLLYLFSTVLSKHFLSYDDWKNRHFPKWDWNVAVRESFKRKMGIQLNKQCESDDDDDGWQMERKKKKSFHFLLPHSMFAFVKWLAEFKCSYYWGNFMTHLNLNALNIVFIVRPQERKTSSHFHPKSGSIIVNFIQKNCSKIEKWKKKKRNAHNPIEKMIVMCTKCIGSDKMNVSKCVFGIRTICFPFVQFQQVTDNHAYWCGLNVVHVFLNALYCTRDAIRVHAYSILFDALKPHSTPFCWASIALILSISLQIIFLRHFPLAFWKWNRICVK